MKRLLPFLLTASLVAFSLILTACQPSPYTLGHHPTKAVAPDLTIELFVEGDPQSTDPLTHQSRYVLEPDRSLHIAVNGQAQRQTYPPFVKYLTRDQMQAFAQLIQNHQLMQATGSKTQDSAHDHAVRYQLSLTSWGKTNHLTTTLDASPGIKALLELFIETGPVHPSGQLKPTAPLLLFHSPSSVESP